MTALFVQSDGRALFPASPAAQIELDGLPKGVHLKVEPKQPRSSKFHRMAFAFFTYVAKALNDGPTAQAWTQDSVREELLCETGHCSRITLTPRQKRRRSIPEDAPAFREIPKSMSWSSMDEVEFSAFMEAAFAYVRDELAPWIEDSPHWEEISAILRACHMLSEPAQGAAA